MWEDVNEGEGGGAGDVRNPEVGKGERSMNSENDVVGLQWLAL